MFPNTPTNRCELILPNPTLRASLQCWSVVGVAKPLPGGKKCLSALKAFLKITYQETEMRNNQSLSTISSCKACKAWSVELNVTDIIKLNDVMPYAIKIKLDLIQNIGLTF